MFQTIMVPLDGSPFGEHALARATDIAQRAHADLQLVHVHFPIGVYGASLVTGPSVAVDPGLDSEWRAQEQAYLERQCHQLGEGGTTNVTWAMLDGPVATTLADYATSGNIDLIVMTTHGRGGLSRLWLGSVADMLMRHGTVPMLVVRPGPLAEETPVTTPIGSILIPLDGSALAEAILAPACMVGTLSQAHVTLVQVVEPVMILDAVSLRHVPDPEHVITRQRVAAAEQYLAGVARQLEAYGHQVQARVMVAEQPGTAILDLAADGHDLIALATHGRGGLHRLRLGSVADKVLRGATMPVLLYRPWETPTK